MKKITLSKIVAGLAIAAISISTSFAQTNLGSECGCPVLSARGTAINLSSLPGMTTGDLGTSGGKYAELGVNTTLTCDKMYTIDRKIYIGNGVTLTIMPGTVIKGGPADLGLPQNAAALIVERGAKLIADGTEACQIVFTGVNDPMDGTYSMTNVGDWGGIVLLGTSPNNLTTANASSAGANGVGFIEGFNAANAFDKYGAGDAAFPTANPADNSGILRYVSIRHAGAVISNGNELNGLSLGSVGSGTTIEHLETIAAADDNIEFFGGTVNVKYCSVLFGDDDFYDWDLGWSGKGQFLFGLAGDSITGLHTTDNGFEADADDNSKSPVLRSHPVIYNATFIGNGHINPSADNTGPAAIQAKELTEGEIYNSVFANFRSGLHLATARSNATNLGDAYDNWTNQTTPYNNGGTGVARKNSLIVKNNTFINFPVTTKTGAADSIRTGPLTKGALFIGKNPAKFRYATACDAIDNAQFTTTDGNTVVASVPGFDYNWGWNAAHTSYASNSFHATPTSNIASSIAPTADGFFSVVNYRGAFDANKSSWINDWALGQVLTSQQSNPTDLNNDGITNTNDFLILVGKFGLPNSK